MLKLPMGVINKEYNNALHLLSPLSRILYTLQCSALGLVIGLVLGIPLGLISSALVSDFSNLHVVVFFCGVIGQLFISQLLVLSNKMGFFVWLPQYIVLFFVISSIFTNRFGTGYISAFLPIFAFLVFYIVNLGNVIKLQIYFIKRLI